MITGRGNQRRRVEVLETNRPPKAPASEDEAMPLIWEVLEDHPKVKAQLDMIKGIREMRDEEAIPLMLDTLDHHPEVKAALIKALDK